MTEAERILQNLYLRMTMFYPEPGPWVHDENGVRHCFVCDGEPEHTDDCPFVEMERYLKRNEENGQ